MDAALGTGDACFRCGRTTRVIRDDGPTVCWSCLFAWGAYAADVAAGTASRGPSLIEHLHWSHRGRRPDCEFCRRAEPPSAA